MPEPTRPMVQWSEDISVADWIVDALHPERKDVGALVPETFRTVARVLHRIERPFDLDADPLKPVHKVRWEDVAEWAGTDVDPLMTWESVRGDTTATPPWGAAEPATGTMPPADIRLLLQRVERYTATPHRCWFALWDAYAWMGPDLTVVPEQPGLVPPEVLAGPKIAVGDRDYVLYRGGMGQALAFIRHPSAQSPNLFWPDDRSWCVATDPALRSTYVAGPTALIDALVTDPHLEAMVAKFDDLF